MSQAWRAFQTTRTEELSKILVGVIHEKHDGGQLVTSQQEDSGRSRKVHAADKWSPDIAFFRTQEPGQKYFVCMTICTAYTINNYLLEAHFL